MDKTELLKYLYFLTKVRSLGNVKIKNIISSNKNLDERYLFNYESLKRVEGINDVIACNIIESKKNFSKTEREFEAVFNNSVKNGIKIISILDKEYPVNLKNIYDAPVILYCKGNLTSNDAYSISVVGTRYPSEYGMDVCRKLVEELSQNMIPIVSGMARGIDSIAHKTSLTKNNQTYAVLGCGADVIYPPENKKIYGEIIENGAVISEFEPGTGPDKVNFPRRNRIISGISVGTLIVETGIKGGSLITAEFALDQNKEVFAVPGNIHSKKSEGCNNLIKKGQAKLVESVEDIFTELSYKLDSFLKKDIVNLERAETRDIELSIFEKSLIDALNTEPKHIDNINAETGLSISDCLVNLLSLEFKGLVKQLPGKYFIRI
jgi:DNA processing protein